jgi:hypothetical protein
LLAEAVRLNPSARVVSLQTRIRLEKNGAEEALAALPPDDEDVETLCARGAALLVLSRLDEAAPVLEAARARKPDDVDAVRLLALLSIMRNDVSRALALAEERRSAARPTVPSPMPPFPKLYVPCFLPLAPPLFQTPACRNATRRVRKPHGKSYHYRFR